MISDANQQALDHLWFEKIVIATANFIMVQIFIEGLKPEIRNEMTEKSWVSLAKPFDKAEELGKQVEQKAMAATKINKYSVNYMSSFLGQKGSASAQKGQNKNQGDNKPQSNSKEV
jgi:hypothetical protein